MYKQSFITGEPKPVSESEFLNERINSLNISLSQKTQPVLENLDLSEIDFSEKRGEIRKNFDGWVIRNVIFSKFNPKSKEKKSLYGLSFRGAKMERVIFAQASLDRCNFDCLENEQINIRLFNRSGIIITDNKCTLNNVDFFFSEFSYCRFRECNMNTVDFRYAKVTDCSMGNIDVTYGDFYYCAFMGCTAFVSGNFHKCSFTNAVFEHQVIRFKSIHGILQNNIKEYRSIIDDPNWKRYNPCGTKSESSLSDEEIRKEAIETYKQFSGIYAGKGLHKDSNAAYKKMKERELQRSWKIIIESVFWLLLFLASLGILICVSIEYGYINCNVMCHSLGVFALCIFFYYLYFSIKDCIKKALQYIYNCLKIKDFCGVASGLFTFIMGYGYRWTFVIFWYVLLIIIGAYKYCNGEIPEKSICKCACDCSKTAEIAYKGFTYSVYNSLGSYVEEYVCVVGSVWANFQTIFSFLLIGYLGFIFANKMRNNL